MLHHLGQGIANIDSEEVRSGILQTVCVTIVEQPHKIPLLGGAIQIANLKNDLMGQVTVELTHSKIQECLDSGDLLKLKNYLRFICALAPLVEGDGVYNLLTGLLEKAIALQSESGDKRNPVAEELYVMVLLSLPYYVKTGEDDKQVNEKYSGQAEEILKLARGFVYKGDQKQLNILKPFVATTGGATVPYEIQEFVNLVRNALESVVEDKWQLNKLIDITSMVKLLAGYEKYMETKKFHVFPALNVPEDTSKFKASFSYQYPKVFFQAYLPTVFETVPAPDSLEGVLLRDLSNDLIYNMDFNRKEVTRQLITLDLFFAKSAFAEPGISFDRLETIEQGNSTWKVEDVALEAILENIFSLPEPSHKPVYYHSILIAACIMAPQSIAPVFGRAIRFLYANLETFDVELFYRLLNWFSHHISNFGFKWKWEEWADDLKLDELHPQRKFIEQLILKEVRLSYPKRVEETLPNEFLGLVPDIPEDPPFEYLEESSPYQEVVKQLISALKESRENVEMENAAESSNSVESVLNEVKEKITSESVGGRADELDKVFIHVIVSTVCHIGNRSLSHAENWIGRTAGTLKKYIDDESKQSQAVEAVLKYWNHQPYVGLTVLNYFVTNNVFSDAVVVSLILNRDDLLLSDAGWHSLLDWIAKSDNSQTLLTNSLSAIATTYTALDKQKEQWKVWWFRGIFRALARKFHVQAAQAAEIKDEELSAILSEAQALNN
jgi:nuclear cap-binding protein subunit 1